MAIYHKLRTRLLGAPRDPFSTKIHSGVALVAVLAWIGLGADGLSSSAYGPEQAFLALGSHSNLALYVAIATSLTVFIISLAYNQVIELFPTGGGGYKVAMQLIGPYAALISGSGLIVDYILTISVSVSTGIDSILSFLPPAALHYALSAKIAATFFLIFLNLRGMKESIRFLAPIFIGFLITHVIIIVYGIVLHADKLVTVFPDASVAAQSVSHSMGWLFVISLLLRAYSLGGGTYTGLEAVSNNVHHLAKPRIRTGKWTMFYMAISLTFTAGGIILLYLLWDVKALPGHTLNAVVFGNILAGLPHHDTLLVVVLLFEAGLLFAGANTGFMGGPAVLANMALDKWLPKAFYNLSSRLVTQNGILLFGLTSLAILIIAKGSVATLVVLYSINVFITFSVSLFGLCIYWWKERHTHRNWMARLLLSLVGFLVCGSILSVTVMEKFTEGGWLTLLVTGTVVAICLIVKRHYQNMEKLLHHLDVELKPKLKHKNPVPAHAMNPKRLTAVFFVGESIGEAMHSLLWVRRTFSNHFKNFIFVSAGVVDVGSYGSDEALQDLKKTTDARLEQLVQFATEHGIAAISYSAFGINSVSGLTHIANEIHERFNQAIFFCASVVLKRENWFARYLHGNTAELLHQRLSMHGMQVIVVPVKLYGHHHLA